MGTPSCYSTDAESPKYCCRPYSQSTTSSNLYTSPTAPHWLPISERIKYKTACICYNTITGSAPSYLSEPLHRYSPSRSLRSSSDVCILKLQRFNRKTWLPHFLTLQPPHLEQFSSRHQAALSSFKSKLKAFLCSEYFS